MASRKQQKAAARAQRLAEEAAAAVARQRAARLRLIAGGASIATLVIATAGGIAIANRSASQKSTVRAAAISRYRLPGLSFTPAPWPPEYTKLSARIAKLNLSSGGDESFHFHTMLSAYVDGKRERVPPDIGVAPSGATMAPIHTHDESGLIHVESSKKFPFQLGDIFGVWGVPFGATTLGAYKATGSSKISVFVNGKPVSQRATYALKNRDDIVVAYGSAKSIPKQPDASALDSV